MLKKLFIYDFRCIGRITLPTLLGMLGASLLSLPFIAIISTDIKSSIITTFSILGLFACLFAVAMFAIAPFIINCFHFAKNMYFDEGYLTMTLPASEHQLLLSKILASALWLLIDALTLIASITIMSISASFFNSSWNVFPILSNISATEALLFCNFISNVIFQLVLGMTVITFGCLLIPKHKILGILLFYIITNWVVNFGTTIISEIFLTLVVPESDLDLSNILTIFSIVIHVILTGLSYFLMHHILKKRINLE